MSNKYNSFVPYILLWWRKALYCMDKIQSVPIHNLRTTTKYICECNGISFY